MSGGFFRGTSADQDTRFSNKRAKLLKSQKFASELDHLVDVTKVKMDVIRPWIANRVTELLGFEDEVLINFIYGLLDGKDVNGKEIQIQITGFMEKNTGKFMKELWSLLLSAQNNASGVPQQFLDAKEEEIRKKKLESDRITHEIQKKKEVDQVKVKNMDDELDALKAEDDASNPLPPDHLMLRVSDVHPKEDKDRGERNGSREINWLSRSSVSSERISPRSMSKSFSNSRNYSERKSRSISISPESRQRTISPERRYRSPRKKSISPHYKNSPRRPRSTVRRRSPYSRRRSSSQSWRRSHSPRRHKSPSPRRRRSPSPRRHNSPSPRRRRSPSPVRRRSLSPRRRRSPSPIRRMLPSPFRRRSTRSMRRRSPSPMRCRSPSPVRRRSPIPSRRRSPTPSRRKSASPLKWKSPSSPRRRSPSPLRRRSPPPKSPKHRRRSPLRSPRKRNRSPSPYRSQSPTYRSQRSLSRDRAIRSNGVGSRRHLADYESERVYGKKSPICHSSQREGQGCKGQDLVSRQQPISLMSPQRDPRDRSDIRQKKPVSSPSPERSPSQSECSLSRKTRPSEDKRNPSLSESPVRQRLVQRTHADSASPVRQIKDRATGDDIPESDGEEEFDHARGYGSKGQRTDSPAKKIRDSPYSGRRNIPMKHVDHDEYSTGGFAEHRSSKAQDRLLENLEPRNKEKEMKSEKASIKAGHHGILNEQSTDMLEEIEYGPGRVQGVRYTLDHVTDKQPYARQLESDSPNKRSQKPYLREDHKVDEKRSESHNIGDSGLDDRSTRKLIKRVDHNNKTATHNSESEENEKNRSENVEKRKHKRTGKQEMASGDDSSYDSHIDERKEGKRRKEEKRLRKEERRQRRVERRRRREDRRASKLKIKTMDTVNSPSDIENIRNDADDSEADAVRRESRPSDAEEMESEHKILEIELRKKALESLRAKKAINP